MTEEQIQKYVESLKLCEHGNYHCSLCEIKLLKFTIDELEQQNKQLIEVLEWYADHTNYHPYRFMNEDGKRARAALQQIQGNK